MFNDLLEKLGGMQQKMEEIKKRLDNVQVKAEAGGGAVQVIVTANKKIVDITIKDDLLKVEEKEQLQDLLVSALNRAMDNAENVSESEMRAAGKGIIPDIPGLFQ